MSLPYLPKIQAPAYLTQCACFSCRKSFKKDLADPRYSPRCPDCGKAMVPMGRYFRAPRKADAAQWKKVEMLSRAGVYFGGRQSSELGRFPDTLLEARAFIAKNEPALQARARARDRWKASAIAEFEARRAKRRLASIKTKKKKAEPAAREQRAAGQ